MLKPKDIIEAKGLNRWQYLQHLHAALSELNYTGTSYLGFKELEKIKEAICEAIIDTDPIFGWHDEPEEVKEMIAEAFEKEMGLS